MTHVSISVSGCLGRMTLDRPEALNALTTEMSENIARALLDWRDDASVSHVLIDSVGERAFCAGGDVVMLHDSGKARDGRAETFWRTEYALNVLLDEYSKPTVALIDGIVMGGGVGISIHGDFRVAGDTTLFAMPETGIGYFPDVGGTWFLPRLDTKAGEALGNWLGLTGARLGAAECFAFGIATHAVPTDRHDDLVEALKTSDDVQATLDSFHVAPEPVPLPDGIEAFLAGDVPEILAALDGQASEWSATQAKLMRRHSPLAMAVTLEALQRGREAETFRSAMQGELTLSLNFLSTQDFYEGIRAQLIDKDRNPKWSHAIGQVPETQIERLFRPAGAPLEFHA